MSVNWKMWQCGQDRETVWVMATEAEAHIAAAEQRIVELEAERDNYKSLHESMGELYDDQAQRIAALEAELAASKIIRDAEWNGLQTKLARTVELLRALVNESAGAVGAFEANLRAILGNTNVNCLQERIAAADAFLREAGAAKGERK